MTRRWLLWLFTVAMPCVVGLAVGTAGGTMFSRSLPGHHGLLVLSIMLSFPVVVYFAVTSHREREQELLRELTTKKWAPAVRQQKQNELFEIRAQRGVSAGLMTGFLMSTSVYAFGEQIRRVLGILTSMGIAGTVTQLTVLGLIVWYLVERNK